MDDNRFSSEFLHGVQGVVEANDFEKHVLWEENRRREKPRDWKSTTIGFAPTIGHLDGMPVVISLMTAIVGGRKILFQHATSQVVDYRMIDKWLNANLPATAFLPNGTLNKTDAQNFHALFLGADVPHINAGAEVEWACRHDALKATGN